MKNDTIFVLNGTSSSGKTTVAKAFQDAMEIPVLYVSNDSFIFMVGARDLQDDQTRPKILLPLLSAFHQSLGIIGQAGFPMIIDHVIERKDWMDEVAKSLEGYRAFFVRVECRLEELERREIQRGDRKIGLARWQNSIIHNHSSYDLEIDTSENTPEANAQKLRDLFYSDAEPQAFRRYRQTLKAEQNVSQRSSGTRS